MKNIFTPIPASRREKFINFYFVHSLIAFILIVSISAVNAQTNTWTGSVNNDWNNAGNWSLGLPSSDHDVLINTSASIVVNAAPTINSLTINNSATVIFTSSAANKTITIDNSGSSIESGSSLALQGSATPGYMRILYAGASNTMSIAGTFTLTAVGGGGRYTSTNSLTTVTGTVINDGTSGGTIGILSSTAANLTFSNGSLYLHAVDGGDVPTATWSVGSTCTVTGITSTACTGLNQNFYNLTWNCPAQTVSVAIGTAPRTFGGNLEILATNSGSLIYCNDVVSTTAATLTLDGNFIFSGGIFSLSTSDCSRPVTFKVLGNFTLNGGTLTKEGLLTHNVNFNKVGTQIFFKSGGTISNNLNFRVLSGSILDLGSSVLDGSTATFNLISGGGIITSHISGIDTTGIADGSIQVGGDRTYSPGANYTYNGISAQVTGTGLVTANNLTIDNTSGVTTSRLTTTVNGTLLINSGSQLTIDPSKRLTVNGTFTNNAGTTGLIIKSDATGTGSLIANSSGVSATVERYITGDRWHFISSPVSGAVSGMFTGKYLQNFNESTNTYSDIISLSEPLTPMSGFALWGDAAGFTSQYTGPLNTGNLSINLSRSVSPGEGWNLVGNPYPCSIDWDDAGWTKTNVNNAIYIERNGGWATYINGVGTLQGTKWIAPGQGFMVNVATNPGTLGISNTVKLHRQTLFFKNTNSDKMVRLEVSGNGYTDEAVVRFMSEVTPEFDGQYDALKLFGYVDESAQIYTLGSTPLAINSTVPGTNEVALGIRANQAGVYTIAATEFEDIPFLTLEDTKTGIYTDIVSKSYSFAFEPGENEVRFMLHFSSTSVKETETASINIYSYQKTAYIDMMHMDKGEIYIYNTAGQLILTVQAEKGINEIALPETGIYIVKVISKDNSLVKKVFIQ